MAAGSSAQVEAATDEHSRGRRSTEEFFIGEAGSRRASVEQTSRPIISRQLLQPNLDLKLKRLRMHVRVVTLIQAFVVLVALALACVTQVVHLVNVIDSVSEYVPPLWAPLLGNSFLIRGALSVASLSLSLVSSVLGYFAAKYTRKQLMCSFWACGVLSSLCGLAAVTYTVLVLSQQSEAVRNTEDYFVNCDVAVHCPSVTGVRKNAVVDCLAASAWPEQYHRLYEYGDPVPGYCPDTFLTCHYERSSINTLADGAVHPQDERRLPMPQYPLISCQVKEEHVKLFHEAGSILPGMWHRLEMAVYTQLLMEIILVGLAFICFVWGRELHRHVKQHPFSV